MSDDASSVQFGLEVSSGFLARAVMYLIGFVGTILFARILGPADFGGYYILLSLVLIAVRPIDGVATAAKKRFSERETFRRELLGSQILVIAGFGAVGGVLAVALRGQLVSYSGLEWAALLFGVLLVSVSFVESTMTLIEGTGRVSISNFVDLLGSVITFPAQLGFVLLGYGAAGMAFGLALSSVVTAFVGLSLLGLSPAVPSRETLASLWSFGKFSVVSSSVAKVLARVDILLLGFFVGPAIAGKYEVALKLSLPAMFLSMVASSGLLARVSNFDSKGDHEPIIIDLKNTLSVTGMFAAPMFFGALALRGSIVVTVYGSKYNGASVFLVWLVLYQFVRTQSSPILNTINGLDRPDLVLGVSVATLLLNVGLGVALLFEIGPVGVVYASVVAETFRYLAGAAFLRRTMADVVLFPRTLLEQVTSGGVMFGVVSATAPHLPVRSWVDLLLLVGLGATVYGVTLFAISNDHRTIARNVFSQFRGTVDG